MRLEVVLFAQNGVQQRGVNDAGRVAVQRGSSGVVEAGSRLRETQLMCRDSASNWAVYTGATTTSAGSILGVVHAHIMHTIQRSMLSPPADSETVPCAAALVRPASHILVLAAAVQKRDLNMPARSQIVEQTVAAIM